MKIILLNRCCDCGFNEHGQEYRIPMQETYLGITIRTWSGTSFGGPMLYCMFNPKWDFRENIRKVTHGFARKYLIIWISGDSRFEGEFERQLHGFPIRCPLKTLK
jgi:hypothetical protein